MLDANLKQQLKAYLDKLAAPIELIAATDSSEASARMLELLREIAALSPRVTLHERVEAGARLPSFAVARPGAAGRVRFAGLPLGHEFSSLVLALLQVSGYPPRVEATTQERIRAIDRDLRFETYVSLSCHNCPDVVQALNLMAALNPRISHTMIDGGLFQQEIDAHGIMGVPAVFLNGESFGQGRMPLEDLLARVDASGDRAAAAALSARERYDVLVIGGGPAGAAAAIYAARKGIRTGIVAERFGGQVQDTLGIENFISVLETEGPRLAAAMEAHVRHYGVDVLTAQRADRLVSERDGLAVSLTSGALLHARSVILAPGARWRDMNVPGEAEYRTRGVTYCPHCDGPFFKGKRVAVIGGGNSGVEAAIDLAGIVTHVTLLEFAPALRADAVLQKKLYSLPNVDVVTQAQTTAVLGDGSKVTGLAYTERASGAARQLQLEGIFVQIGLLPGTDWLKGSVELSPRGEIVVDDHGATSQPGVFAAGDATTVPYKQIVIAMGEGAKAALSAFDYLIRRSVKEVV